jgi:hypothetical protein
MLKDLLAKTLLKGSAKIFIFIQVNIIIGPLLNLALVFIICKIYIVLCLFNLAKWWLNHGSSAPNLRKLAARILSLTCSSSACERCWSSFEQV